MVYQWHKKEGWKSEKISQVLCRFSAFPPYTPLYRKNFIFFCRTSRNRLKVGKGICTNGYLVRLGWDNPMWVWKMAYLARHFFSQSETPPTMSFSKNLVRKANLFIKKVIKINHLTRLVARDCCRLQHQQIKKSI